MPVAVPNSFTQKTNLYNNENNRYNNNLANEIDSLMEENESKSYYLIRLEQKIKRLENINNIFLNLLRENSMNENMYRNYSYNDLAILGGQYPYLSFDKNRNKNLLYLNQNKINNNHIMNGKYKTNYLVPILPRYNSVAENNRYTYLLNNEKLKYFRKDTKNNSKPYFFYNNRTNNVNIPQKINSVQYFNNKIDYKKYNTNTTFNSENNSIENKNANKSKTINNTDIRNEINRLNNNLNTRLTKIENLQKTQKKDIDYLLGKSGGNKSEKSSKKDNEENKNNNNNKKEEGKKESKESEESDDDEEDEEEEDDDK